MYLVYIILYQLFKQPHNLQKRFRRLRENFYIDIRQTCQTLFLKNTIIYRDLVLLYSRLI